MSMHSSSIDRFRQALQAARPKLWEVKKPASEADRAHVEACLGCPSPPILRKLQDITAGFGTTQFDARFGAVSMYELFPHAVQVDEDGLGNQWILDVGPGDDSRVIYWCHDPPVIFLMTRDLAEFATWRVEEQVAVSDDEEVAPENPAQCGTLAR